MPEQSPTLRDMIQTELDNGATYRQLGSRAVDEVTGKRASPSTFYDIANGDVERMPRDYHLRAIAVALNVPYERVRRAAITQWLPADESVDAVGLTEDEREQLKAEALRLRDIADEALARIDRETGGGGSTRRRSA